MTWSGGLRHRRSRYDRSDAADADAGLSSVPLAASGNSAARLIYRVLHFPFRLIGTALLRISQVIFSIVFLFLHPQLKWLLLRLWRSRLVRDYVRPALSGIVSRIYRPYLDFLRRLPPIPATLSIATPLAVLEPAKLYATILIVQHPKTGLALLLFLHGLSFVLIDTTWMAVRPQSRKIWLVSRLHALIWLNVAYGKYWVTHSAAYLAMEAWAAEARRILRAFLARLHTRRTTKNSTLER
jgi:hypothetical protein